MSNLVELPITLYFENGKRAGPALMESELLIDLSDIRSISRIEYNLVRAVDLHGNEFDIDTDYDVFKKAWLCSRNPKVFSRKVG